MLAVWEVFDISPLIAAPLHLLSTFLIVRLLGFLSEKFSTGDLRNTWREGRPPMSSAPSHVIPAAVQCCFCRQGIPAAACRKGPWTFWSRVGPCRR